MTHDTTNPFQPRDLKEQIAEHEQKAWEFIRNNQVQACIDGTLVTVSRQALEETLCELERSLGNEAFLQARLNEALHVRDLHYARAERFRARIFAAQDALSPIQKEFP